MTKKRGNNEGSIYPYGNGRWRTQVSIDGHRVSFIGKTQKECQEWIFKTRSQIKSGMTFSSTLITVDEYFREWLITIKPSFQHKSTWTQYNQVARDFIIPFIGKVKIVDLRPEQVQGLFNCLLEKGVGVHSIRKTRTVLHSALSHAVKMGIIVQNPATNVTQPREPVTEMKILDEVEVNRLLFSVQNHRWEALYHLAVTTGMRQMELLGLKWTDLDWQQKTIKVERQLLRASGHVAQFGPTKTKNGKRIIDLGTGTINVLRQHNQQQQSDRIKAGNNWTEQELIFTNQIGGPIDSRNLLRDFKKVLENAGLPEIRFHDLRHTSASIMLNHGTPVIVVSRRLGHAKPSTTLDVYGHLIPSFQREAAEMIDTLLMPVELHKIAHELHTKSLNQ